MLGVFLALGTALVWGLMAACMRVGTQHLRASVGTLISLFASLATALVLVLLLDLQGLMAVSREAVAWFALIGVLNFTLARYFVVVGIVRLGTTRSQPVSASAPLFVTILAMVFLGETPTPLMLVGILAVVAGIYLVTGEGAT